MKISKWEQVNNIEISHHRKISYGDGCICIHVGLFGDTALVVDTIVYPPDVVCDVLRCVGFDIEFEEPPKLSEREWHLVNYLSEDWWIARHADMGIYVYKAEPKKGSNGFWTPVFWQEMLLNRCLFPFITPDRAWSVKELRELEAQDDD